MSGPTGERRTAQRGALAEAASGGDFSVGAAVGGPRGLAESVLPGLAFVVCFTVTGELRTSLLVAVGGAAALVLVRLVLRQPLGPALGGLLGVGVCALVARGTGRAEDFYLPGFLANAGYAAAFALSTVRWPGGRGPYPAVGLVAGALTGGGTAWRADPRLLRLYQRLTWLWVGVFALRLAVQLPLYAAGALAALGAARIAMGLPLFAVAGWVTWLAVRRATDPPRDSGADDGMDGATDGATDVETDGAREPGVSRAGPGAPGGRPRSTGR